MKLEELGIRVLSERVIAFHPILARAGGSAGAGLFMSQLLYWVGKQADGDGWIYKTMEEWQEETCLTRFEVERARRRWRELEVLEEKYEGLPRRLWYRLNLDRLKELLEMDMAYHNMENKDSDGDGGCGACGCGDGDAQTCTRHSASLYADFSGLDGVNQRAFINTKTTTKTTTDTPQAGVTRCDADGASSERARKDKMRSEVREHFTRRTGLRPPGGDGAKHKREMAALWWNPIAEICELAGWDVGAACKLIDAALEKMEELTVSDPNSIVKTCRAVAGEMALRRTSQERQVEQLREKLRRERELAAGGGR